MRLSAPVITTGLNCLLLCAIMGSLLPSAAGESSTAVSFPRIKICQTLNHISSALPETTVPGNPGILLTPLQLILTQAQPPENHASDPRYPSKGFSWNAVSLALMISLLLMTAVLLWNLSLRRQIAKTTQSLAEQNRLLELSHDALQRDKAALRTAHNLNEAFFDQTLQFMALLNRDGSIIRINQTVLKFCGLTLPQVEGTLFHEGCWWIDPDEATRICGNAYQAALQGQTFRHEVRHIDHQRNIIYVDFSISPLRDEKGEVIYLIAEGHDISGIHQVQEALANSERRFRAIFDNAPYSIAINRIEDGAYLAVNKAFIESSGLSEAELLNLHSQDLFRLSEQELEQIYQALFTHGVIKNFETTIKHKNGSAVHIIFSSVLLDNQGQPEVLSMTIDVTGKKRAEEALRESERQFRTITESAFDLICLIDIEGYYLYCNPSYETILGYQPSDLVGKNSLLIVHPEERERAKQYLHSEIERGVTQTRTTLRLICKDGSIKWVDHRLAIISGDDGKPQKVLIMGQDLSDRIQAEAERDRLMAAIEQAEEVLVITDPEGIIQYTNPAFERITGYSREEAIGKKPSLLKSGKHDKTFYSQFWQTIKSGKPWRGHFINKRKDGSLFTEESIISPVLDSSGQIVNFVAAKHDITSQLALEEQYRQSQKMEALGQLTGGVAHDFNNLLQVINGYTSMAIMDIEPGNSVLPLLNEVDKAGQRAAALVQQLLIFSRRQVMQPKYMDLNDLVTDMLKMLTRVIGEHIRLDWVPERNLGIIYADSGMLDQVLMNLCVNARDAMPNGGVLTIETHRTEIDQEFCNHHLWAKPGHFAQLIVSDTGCGMSKETQDHVFEPFFTTKSEGKGTGLGLSTVYGIVKQHNGMVNVYSEVGKGTSFKIYLPFHESASGKMDSPVEKPVVGGNEVILLAEDDEMVRNLSKTILMKAGYTVLEARDGIEAIEIFKENPDLPGLLLLDVVMPHLGGQSVLEKIQEIRPHIPSLFASGYSDGAIHTEFVLHEGLRLIGKPYTSSTLLRAVREALDAAKA